MNRTFVLSVLLACVTSMTSAQFVFGVKPGLTMNSGQVGFKMNNLVLLGGLEFLRTTATTDESGTRLDYVYSPLPPYGSYQLTPYSDKTESSANLYVPFIGAKLLLGGQETGKAGAYVTGYVAKPIVTGKNLTNGKEDEGTKKFFDNLSVWAFQAGFGGEYFFNDTFSIGGEFGLRAFFASYNEQDSQTQTVFDGMTTRSYTTTSKYNLDLGLGLTYSTLCLNFYF